jgi:serine phosphatase RsbU (regulator of sigma subunit)
MLEEEMGIGDLLFAYSDGVVEAQSPSGELFGEQRLQRVIATSPPDPDTVADRVLVALDQFTQGQMAYDDLTMIAARWLGEEQH